MLEIPRIDEIEKIISSGKIEENPDLAELSAPETTKEDIDSRQLLLSNFPWELIDGETSFDKAAVFHDELIALSKLLDKNIDSFEDLQFLVDALPLHFSYIFEKEVYQNNYLSSESNPGNEDGILAPLLLKALPWLKYNNENLNSSAISDDEIREHHSMFGSYRTLPKNSSSLPGYNAKTILALNNFTTSPDIVTDLLNLANKGKLVPSNRIQSYEQDNSRLSALHGFYYQIKWEVVPGQGPEDKVVTLLRMIDRLKEQKEISGQKFVFDFSSGREIMTNLRAESLLRMSISSEDLNFSKDKTLDEILEKLYRTRKTVRTLPPDNAPYLNDYIARHIVDEAGVSIKELSLVYDVWNLAHGGRILPSAQWVPYLDKILKEKNTAPSAITKEINTQLKVFEIISSVKMSDVRGISARHRVVAFLSLLATGQQADVDIRKNNLTANVIDLDAAVSNISDPKQVSNKITATVAMAKSMDPAESRLLIEALSDTGSAGSGHGTVSESRIIANYLLRSPLIREIANLSLVLKGLTKNAPNSRDKEDNKWKEVGDLESIQQLKDALPAEYAMFLHNQSLLPLRFELGMVQGLVDFPDEAQDQKGDEQQLSFFLVDSSGSMDRISRIGLASAILLNRLTAVASNKAKLFYAFFDGDLHTVNEITTRAQATETLRKVMKHNYSGYGTSFDNAIRKSIEKIISLKQERPNLITPEITIVTDGEDRLSVTLELLQGIVLNVILVDGAKNDQLVDLSLLSGGTCIQVSGNGDVMRIRRATDKQKAAAS